MHIRYRITAFYLALCSMGSAQNMSQDNSVNDSLTLRNRLDQVLISTKRLNSNAQEQPSTLILDQQAISGFSGQSVAAMLNQIGGIEIGGATGHPGQNLGYFIRGGNNRQVLIMIDGAVVSDASSIASDFDLRLLAADQIESISIVRGPSSVLYGSGAATAVVFIKTKNYNKPGSRFNLNHATGTNRSTEDVPLGGLQRQTSAGLDWRQGPWSMQAQASTRFADGLSAIAPFDQGRSNDPDEYGQLNTRVRVKYSAKNSWSMEQFFAYDKHRQDFDNFNYQDAPFQSSTEQWRTGGSFYYLGKNSRYEFHDQWSHTIRDISSDYPAVFNALNYNADQFLTTQWNNQVESVIGAQGGWSSMDLAQGAGLFSPLSTVLTHRESRTYFIDSYLNTIYKPVESLVLEIGGRWHHHMRYGNQGVYQISPQFNFSNPWGSFSLYARYGTSFIAPSLYQLYDPIYGNKDLQPEMNRSSEVGLIWQQYNSELSLRWFNRFEQQAVIFDLLDPDQFVYQYTNNAQDQRRYGIELEGILEVSSMMNMSFFYTWVSAKDFELLRIPAHKFNWHGNFIINDHEKINLRWTWSDIRRDQFFNATDFTTQQVNLRPYHWIDLVYSASLSHGLNAQLSITNLLNQKVQPLYRYTGQGRNFLIGLSYSLTRD